MATLSNNVAHAIKDFDNIKDAIEDMGVEVPEDTSTSSYPQKIREIEQGITPSGTLEISENGNYDITNYAEAAVAVPQPSGKITLTENATDVDISEYAIADIAVPQGVFPEGTINITENGSHDVSSYESANVNVVSLDDYLEGSVVNYTGHATKVVENALSNTGSLVSINLPDVERVDRYGFAYCYNLTTVRLESCTYLHTEAFYNCSKLESVYIPELTNVGGTYSAGQSGNFTYCHALKSVNFPKLKNIGVSEFSNSGLEVADFPEVTTIASDAFANCQSLIYIKLPKVQSFSDVVHGCTALERVELPAVTTLASTAFTSCTALTALILGTRLRYPSTSVYPYSPSFDLPSQTIIYVENADLNWYASDNNWSTLYNAGRIKSIDELPPLESNNS